MNGFIPGNSDRLSLPICHSICSFQTHFSHPRKGEQTQEPSRKDGRAQVEASERL